MRREAGPILAIDTATAEAIVALGARDGTLLDADAWLAGHRHGEELLGRVDAILSLHDVSVHALGAIAVGTGPGAFTGLRVGIATAKGLAVGLGIPIVGVSTAAALAAAVPGAGERPVAILLPAGPSDRTIVHGGRAERLLGADVPDLPAEAVVAAIDLPGRATDDQLALGEAARRGFAAALVRLACARLAETGGDDPARLVPDYVTLPRGLSSSTGEVAWSRTRA
ncbi:MAG: tRNA (adenosine(37)-N6)-threonylcarbamoyltransferase complex dimerization subunit type 1 TsaB [Chloroflexota bacterium]